MKSQINQNCFRHAKKFFFFLKIQNFAFTFVLILFEQFETGIVVVVMVIRMIKYRINVAHLSYSLCLFFRVLCIVLNVDISVFFDIYFYRCDVESQHMISRLRENKQTTNKHCQTTLQLLKYEGNKFSFATKTVLFLAHEI